MPVWGRRGTVSKGKLLEAARLSTEPMVGQDQGQHRFSHDHEAWQKTGVMAAFDQKVSGLAGSGDCPLGSGNRTGRLEGDPAHNGLTARNASEHTAVTVGFGGQRWNVGG
jgi:hypothetical protein